MRKGKKISKAKRVSKTRTAPIDGPAMLPPDAQNHIRNWRLYRGIKTQKELAELSIAHDPEGQGVIRGVICRLESGNTRYHAEHIAILSRTLRCSPRDLIGTNPNDAGDIFAVYAGLSEADKRRAAKLVADLRPKSPDA